MWNLDLLRDGGVREEEESFLLFARKLPLEHLACLTGTIRQRWGTVSVNQGKHKEFGTLFPILDLFLHSRSHLPWQICQKIHKDHNFTMTRIKLFCLIFRSGGIRDRRWKKSWKVKIILSVKESSAFPASVLRYIFRNVPLFSNLVPVDMTPNTSVSTIVLESCCTIL